MSRQWRNRMALCGLALAASACIPSSVTPPQDRMATAADVEVAFAPATAADVVGFHESVDIQGDAAATLRRIYYLFAGDGTYTGAALADDGERSAFQTLSGNWQLTPEGLVLDGQPAVACEAAPGQLRIAAPTGILRLKRGKVE